MIYVFLFYVAVIALGMFVADVANVVLSLAIRRFAAHRLEKQIEKLKLDLMEQLQTKYLGSISADTEVKH